MRAIARVLTLLLACNAAVADDAFISAKRQEDYHVALDELSVAIMDKGYTVVKIQPVDQGLRSKGYPLYENYKVVFFGNEELEQQAIAAAPELATLLPLKVVLYQDQGRVVATTQQLESWRKVFPSRQAQAVLQRFDRDLQAILEQYGGKVRTASR